MTSTKFNLNDYFSESLEEQRELNDNFKILYNNFEIKFQDDDLD